MSENDKDRAEKEKIALKKRKQEEKDEKEEEEEDEKPKKKSRVSDVSETPTKAKKEDKKEPKKDVKKETKKDTDNKGKAVGSKKPTSAASTSTKPKQSGKGGGGVETEVFAILDKCAEESGKISKKAIRKELEQQRGVAEGSLTELKGAISTAVDKWMALNNQGEDEDE
jgi:FtsZ-interacting cell division protein ZipA